MDRETITWRWWLTAVAVTAAAVILAVACTGMAIALIMLAG